MPKARPLRADARRNYDLLIEAADAEFTEKGAAASLEDIAKRAGVGIGTLYRHFPTRDDLIAKVLDVGNTALIQLGHDLLTAPCPSGALSEWIHALVENVTTYRGLTTALASGFLRKSDNDLCEYCVRMTDAAEKLLVRAQQAGEIRADAVVKEIILTAHAAAWIAEETKDPSAVDRLLAILFDGLRPSAAQLAAPEASPAATKRRARARN